MRSYPRFSDDAIQLLAALALAAAIAMALGYAVAAEAAGPPISSAAKSNAAGPNAAVSGSAVSSPAASSPAVSSAPRGDAAPVSSAPADSGMTLQGGQERTDFRTMTVEGEDRVHVEVERPKLVLDLDPEKVAGLESGTARDVLNRVPPDLTTDYLALSAHEPSPYLARPWLEQFATGAVAKFQPAVKGVERWKLVVADSKGQAVAKFEGKGDPPKEIAWDGRTQGGSPVTPGLTYSYFFEAFDRAGNKRNFVGEGFKVSAYRLDSPSGPVLVFSGLNMVGAQGSGRVYGGAVGSRPTPPILLEAASWINQSSRIAQPIRVTGTARSYEQANMIAKQAGAAMAELTIGDPARVQTVAEVVPDAPDGGTVRIGFGIGTEAPGAVGAVVPAATKNPKGKDGAKKGKK